MSVNWVTRVASRDSLTVARYFERETLASNTEDGLRLRKRFHGLRVVAGLVLCFAFGAQLLHLGQLVGAELWIVRERSIDLFHVHRAVSGHGARCCESKHRGE